MAEKDYSNSEKILPDLNGDALQVHGIDERDEDVKNFSGGTEFLWQIICAFLKNLSDEDKLKARREFCSCVNIIIGAYEERVHEIKELRHKIKELERETRKLRSDNKNKNQIIKQHKSTISQLEEQIASSVCKECAGQKSITGQFSHSLSLSDPEGQADKNESLEPRENEEDESIDETDATSGHISGEVTDSQYSFFTNILCPHAPCGLVAMLCMLVKKGIFFCPTKFLQKIGAITRKEKPSCTKILNNLKGLGFIERLHKCPSINEGEHEEELKIVQTKLNNSGHEVGILSYSTESYNHCVTVYLETTTNEEPQLKICDANLERENIKDLEQVCSLELLILKYNKDDVASIVSAWGDECHSLLCVVESNALSKPNHHLLANAVQDVTNSEM